ncbi:MAG: hypothetical protein UU09_C0042G0003 [Microgenomates group bacterium GW2011_GWA2_40_6]|nr:MAG: hypothetical protein UU09_C0042G0003 [Microgenomates group bacterium GW2011_GWA2_40_6]
MVLSGRKSAFLGATVSAYNFFQTGGNIFDITSFYVVLCAVSYLIIVGIVSRVFLYIVFGGLEDDMKPKIVPMAPVPQSVSGPGPDGSAAVVNYLKQAEQKRGEAVTWIILIIIFIWIAVYYSTSSTPSSSTSGWGSKTKTSTCIPTGCGSNWQCAGTYYSSSGSQKSISGCYADKTSITSLNSWSGICRKCP